MVKTQTQTKAPFTLPFQGGNLEQISCFAVCMQVTVRWDDLMGITVWQLNRSFTPQTSNGYITGPNNSTSVVAGSVFSILYDIWHHGSVWKAASFPSRRARRLPQLNGNDYVSGNLYWQKSLQLSVLLTKTSVNIPPENSLPPLRECSTSSAAYWWQLCNSVISVNAEGTIVLLEFIISGLCSPAHYGHTDTQPQIDAHT